MSGDGNIVQRRPAETSGVVAGAAAFLIAKIIGVEDVDTVGYITILVGAVPAGVTWLVTTIRG